MSSHTHVILSVHPSAHPVRRRLEADLVATLSTEPNVALIVVPHLYDLQPNSRSIAALQDLTGDLIVLSWLYPRAARWTLDGHGIRGLEGTTSSRWSEAEESPDVEPAANDAAPQRALDERTLPERHIYCIDLRRENTAEPYVTEVRRIVSESGKAQRVLEPADEEVIQIEESVRRRWYPVIDYSRCTNCMECVDFCLFGVYGIDEAETILVEQPDNCRQGCPACSRVCPEHAILFPQHKTPAIAGSAAHPESLKLDLSQLFGAPEQEAPARDVAAEEREQHLRQAAAEEPKDDLDRLLDTLDEFDQS